MAGIHAYMGQAIVLRWRPDLGGSERQTQVERLLTRLGAEAASRGIVVAVFTPEDDLLHRTHVVVGEHLGDLHELDPGQVAVLHPHDLPEHRRREVQGLCAEVRALLGAVPDALVEPAPDGLVVVLHRPVSPGHRTLDQGDAHDEAFPDERVPPETMERLG